MVKKLTWCGGAQNPRDGVGTARPQTRTHLNFLWPSRPEGLILSIHAIRTSYLYRLSQVVSSTSASLRTMRLVVELGVAGGYPMLQNFGD